MFGLTTTDAGRELPDEEVLTRSQKEPWMFAVLLDRYQDAFMRKARSILRSEEDAEEVVQDTFTKVYMNADRFEPRPNASFSSWAYRILTNTACTMYKKRVRENARVMPLDPQFEHTIEAYQDHSGFDLKWDAIHRVLAELPPHLARVLELHYLERWSHKDIAALQNETHGSVKSRIHRAKAEFRKEADIHEIRLGSVAHFLSAAYVRDTDKTAT